MNDKYEALDRGFTRLAEKMFTRTERTDGLRVIHSRRVAPEQKMMQCSSSASWCMNCEAGTAKLTRAAHAAIAANW